MRSVMRNSSCIQASCTVPSRAYTRNGSPAASWLARPPARVGSIRRRANKGEKFKLTGNYSEDKEGADDDDDEEVGLRRRGRHPVVSAVFREGLFSWKPLSVSVE